jgi:hypothetical protein
MTPHGNSIWAARIECAWQNLGKANAIFGNLGQLYLTLPASYPETNSLISVTCHSGSVIINLLTVDKLKSNCSSQWTQP